MSSECCKFVLKKRVWTQERFRKINCYHHTLASSSAVTPPIPSPHPLVVVTPSTGNPRAICGGVARSINLSGKLKDIWNAWTRTRRTMLTQWGEEENKSHTHVHWNINVTFIITAHLEFVHPNKYTEYAIKPKPTLQNYTKLKLNP